MSACRKHHIDVSRDEIVEGLAQPAIGDLHRLDASEHFELDGRQMPDRANARRRGRDLARIGLGARDQFRNRRSLEVLAQHEHVRTRCQQGDRDPARGTHLFVEKSVGRDGAGRSQEQRVAVRGCARDLGGADIAGRAADILHDCRLTPFAAELLGEQARERVGAAAGEVKHDDPHQPRGISLLRAACFAWEEDGERGQRHKTDLDPSHRRFSCAPRTLKAAAQC